MEVARFADKANDLRPNVEACADYGGCYHRNRCERSPLSVFSSAFEILDRREKTKAKEKQMQPRTPKLPPPRAHELPQQPQPAAAPAERPGMDPQAVLANWPQDADDPSPAAPTEHVADLPPAQVLGQLPPRMQPRLPGAAAEALAPSPPAPAPAPTPAAPPAAPAPVAAPVAPPAAPDGSRPCGAPDGCGAPCPARRPPE